MKIRVIAFLYGIFVFSFISAQVSVKVGDISYIDGLKENQVFGYGLIVGLQGTGDSRINVTKNSLRNLLKNLGLEEDDVEKSKNVAAVLVTASLPEMVRVGDRIDVTVSSIGDAKSIEGGMLVQAPLKGADGNTYIVAQGRVSSVESGRAGRKLRTTALISRGGIVERDIETVFSTENMVTLVLNEWDFDLANQIVENVLAEYPDSRPSINQNGKITFTIPENVNFSIFIARVQDMEVTPDYGPRVVINEKEGTIVMGGSIKVSESVVSKDGLTISVRGEKQPVGAALIKESTTVKDVVEALNYAGLEASDIVSVLKALRDAGALHAELIIK
ncbi:MAG: flagellar basal body P-ring protein FlgI [Spirochaetes bacterium]|nr:flagellar basal body P-ring protein FlgI [Spirochaetota bacterium]MBN2770939.1 flagellar basal body P-ring protein FlgI [Spirochaetota bacterium]